MWHVLKHRHRPNNQLNSKYLDLIEFICLNIWLYLYIFDYIWLYLYIFVAFCDLLLLSLDPYTAAKAAPPRRSCKWYRLLFSASETSQPTPGCKIGRTPTQAGNHEPFPALSLHMDAQGCWKRKSRMLNAVAQKSARTIWIPMSWDSMGRNAQPGLPATFQNPTSHRPWMASQKLAQQALAWLCW